MSMNDFPAECHQAQGGTIQFINSVRNQKPLVKEWFFGKRVTGLEPVTFCLGSKRSTN